MAMLKLDQAQIAVGPYGALSFDGGKTPATWRVLIDYALANTQPQSPEDKLAMYRMMQAVTACNAGATLALSETHAEHLKRIALSCPALSVAAAGALVDWIDGHQPTEDPAHAVSI
jgi:hypothetical protein